MPKRNAYVLRQCVLARAPRQGGVKRGVEYRHVRHAREQFARAAHGLERGWIVQRRQRSSAPSVASVASSMTVGAVKRSPPCTMRWTTASSSPSSAHRSRNAANTASSAAGNPAIRARAWCLSPITSRASAAPMFSSRSSNARSGGSPAIRAHLIDELPQLIARTRTGLTINLRRVARAGGPRARPPIALHAATAPLSRSVSSARS